MPFSHPIKFVYYKAEINWGQIIDFVHREAIYPVKKTVLKAGQPAPIQINMQIRNCPSHFFAHYMPRQSFSDYANYCRKKVLLRPSIQNFVQGYFNLIFESAVNNTVPVNRCLGFLYILPLYFIDSIEKVSCGKISETMEQQYFHINTIAGESAYYLTALHILNPVIRHTVIWLTMAQ